MSHSLGDGIRAVNEASEKQRAAAVDLIKSLGGVTKECLIILTDAAAIAMAENAYLFRDLPGGSARSLVTEMTHIGQKAAQELVEKEFSHAG